MTINQRAAYELAQRAIAKALAKKATVLDLSVIGNDTLKHLSTLPPEIADLQGLQTLYLSGTHVADLAPLANMQGLQTLYLTSTQVADLAPLANLQSLQTLDLGNTQVADLAPMANLHGLQTLNLNNTQVADLAQLANLQGLQTLYLRNTQIADLAQLVNLQGLQTLFLNSTQVADLRPLLSLNLLWDKAGEDGPTDIHSWAIWFRDTPATRADPKLAELSEIDDNKTRTQQTRAYLQTLPAWPAPLGGEDDAKGDEASESGDDMPDTPGGKPAPLMVRMDDDGDLQTEATPDTLEDMQRQRAAEAWDALQHYLADLAPLREKISNRMPNLARALDSLERALGPDFATMNQIDIGLQADRVARLSAGADDYLLDQDPEELAAFAAALALYVRRFTEWENYKDDPPPPRGTLDNLREDKDVFVALRDGLAAEGKTGEPVLAALDDLIEAATADGATDLDARALLDSESNVFDQVAERSLEVRKDVIANDPDQWDKINKESGQAFQNSMMANPAVSGSVWVVSYLYRHDNLVNRIAARYPETFGFLANVMRLLCP